MLSFNTQEEASIKHVDAVSIEMLFFNMWVMIIWPMGSWRGHSGDVIPAH